MDKLGEVSVKTISLFGHTFTVNPTIITMTWLVMAILVISGFLLTRNLKSIPTKIQSMGELVFEFVEDLTLSTLGKEDGKPFVPFIFTLFIFILAANWIGIIPNFFVMIGSLIALIHKLFGGSVEMVINGITSINIVPNPGSWYYFLFKTPNFQEPTRSVNTDLAMAVIVFFIVHIYSIRRKGFIEYLKGYWGDVIPCHGWWLLLFPINLFIPLNIIGEVSSVVSHSFRLFGNIFGGFMIVTIVSSLVKFVAIPIGLLAFFGLFAGLVQAFVFTMLAITYIGQKA